MREQCAVGDVVADVAVLHGQTVLASFGIRVDAQGGAILEAKTGEEAYARRSDLFEKPRALMESWSEYLAT